MIKRESYMKQIRPFIGQNIVKVLTGIRRCGKSTLLRHMKSCLAPHGRLEGEILYKGKGLAQVEERVQAAEIGYIMQSPENQVVIWDFLTSHL